MFSILIPSWNNKLFLQLCVESIRSYSNFAHQIIIHVNDGSDGTLDWVRQEGLDYTYTTENEGVCIAVNLAAKLARFDYIVFMNDDMFALPGWDTELLKEIEKLSDDCFMLSATMIEPFDTKNRCVIVGDYGRGVSDFKREELLAGFQSYKKNDWSGSTWPPSVVHKKWWNKAGGYSEEFSPGMSSDDDFAMKMWQAGCRLFKGLGSSRVYHFISKSTGRVVKNDGRRQFFNKWKIKQSAFHRYYLKRGEPYTGKLQEPATGVGFYAQKLIALFGKRER
jgi:glycosyltransferase involved in cell wall biosynthesis